jgi:hypothetical protein
MRGEEGVKLALAADFQLAVHPCKGLHTRDQGGSKPSNLFFLAAASRRSRQSR